MVGISFMMYLWKNLSENGLVDAKTVIDFDVMFRKCKDKHFCNKNW